MRTLVDIGDADIEELDRIAQTENVSRASLIRNAVRDYLGKNAKQKQIVAFGLWAEGAVDGLEFQQKIRSEW
ncbi:metal-responsive CopG/Arc/MetJ family transcriptional regulator [Neorhizobium huautlense]|uniref:Metal-responsive CopG/Arc/MetJ family transcriptional regulator n=1 Tax=Neorhizobium huautlense TaxID=67774 RepID=A0ABT9PMI0_9HYPH|nr:CopG family transcriptional regulator [Neorhizobium huautlense]MDP9835651.1 metal-responsive CopG/Arc/MetJ family transcriptional regulator [Neorhizobium huautlense]